MNPRSDPYVVVRAAGNEQKTPTIDNNLNPVWQELCCTKVGEKSFRFLVCLGWMLGWRLKAHDKNHAKWLSCNELILVALLEETFQDKNLFNFSIGANDHKVELEAAGNFWVVGNALFSPLYTGGDDLTHIWSRGSKPSWSPPSAG